MGWRRRRWDKRRFFNTSLTFSDYFFKFFHHHTFHFPYLFFLLILLNLKMNSNNKISQREKYFLNEVNEVVFSVLFILFTHHENNCTHTHICRCAHIYTCIHLSGGISVSLKLSALKGETWTHLLCKTHGDLLRRQIVL